MGKKIILTLVIVICFSIICGINILEKDENVEVKLSYSYSKWEKQIIIEGTFTNISDSTIFVDEFNNGKWKIKDTLYLFYPDLYFPSNSRPDNIYHYEYSTKIEKLYELKPKQCITFKLNLRSGEKEYDYLLPQGFFMHFSFYTYSPVLEKAFMEGDIKQKSGKLMFALYGNYRTISANITFED